VKTVKRVHAVPPMKTAPRRTKTSCRADPSVKGMWCVPKYSNPTGEVYATPFVERLASMRTAARDFRELHRLLSLARLLISPVLAGESGHSIG
jgi:hypothetical protein